MILKLGNGLSLYSEYGKQMHRYIGNILKENEFFLFCDTDSEFRNVSYDCYSKFIKRFPFLKVQIEMLFLFIKDYHREKVSRGLILGYQLYLMI